MPAHAIIKEDITAIINRLGKDAERFSGKTVIVSGGAGFLGRYFLGFFSALNERVLAEPCRVISLDNYITGSAEHLDEFGPHVTHITADVALPLPPLPDADFVIHAAGIASPVYYQRYPLETIESAVSGSKTLLEYARKSPNLEGFLFFSSSEIYGDPDPKFVPTPETYHGHVSSIGPRACYDESKRLGETLAVLYHQLFGIPVTIVRPFNVYGPGMAHDDFRVIPMFTFKALNNETIPIHGEGAQTRTFCYVTDAIAGFVQTLLHGKPGEAYNIGNADEELSMRALAEKVCGLEAGARYELIPYPKEYPAGEPQRRCPDLRKAREHFGYTYSVPLYEGLIRFMEWAKSDPRYTK